MTNTKSWAQDVLDDVTALTAHRDRLRTENAKLREALLEIRMNLHAVRIAGDNIPTPERYSFTNSADAEEIEGVIRYVQGIVETYGIEVNDG